MITTEEIVSWMAQGPEQRAVQLVQTAFKRRVADFWQLPPGARILEVGCGQGDMTAVLAAAIGPEGHVTGVDIAEPGYGSPITVGDATRNLLASPIGPRLDFRLGCDVLDPAISFDGPFDIAVMAHSSWYFSSAEQLGAVLRRLRSWCGCLCFSEWDLVPGTVPQVAHMLAVLAQGEIEAYKPTSDANVRTPLSRERLFDLVRSSGWSISREGRLDSSELQDSAWEVGHCLQASRLEARSLELPPRLLALIESQLDLLEEVSKREPPRSLGSYALVAR